jgi:hypothetical protein
MMTSPRSTGFQPSIPNAAVEPSLSTGAISRTSLLQTANMNIRQVWMPSVHDRGMLVIVLAAEC